MISQAILKELLSYDENTGKFHWKVSRAGNKKGSLAGTINSNGYIVIRIFSKEYRAHRLVFLYINGVMPIFDVDHINGDRIDNRAANLREVTRSQNMQNLRVANSRSSSGLIGAGKNRDRWAARIWVNGKRIHLGYFHDPESAHNAYLKAKREHHIGCTI